MPFDPVAGQKAADVATESTRKILEDAGITLKVLTDKLQDELDATETKFFAYQGKVMDQEDVIVWEIRQRARQDAHKLRGDYPAEQIKGKFDISWSLDVEGDKGFDLSEE